MSYQPLSTFEDNFKILYTESPSSLLLTTGYQSIPESYIDYKPAPSSSHVIYQFSFFYDGRKGTSSNEFNITMLLQYSDNNGSTWSDWGDNTETYFGSAGSYFRGRSTVDMKWCLDVTGWDNVKRLRVQAKEDTGSDVTLFLLQSFYDSTGEVTGDFYYNPSVSCVSLE